MKAKLIGSKITKIEAERSPDFSGNLSLSTNINIISIEKFKPESSNIESLKIEASFKVDYADLGRVVITGQLFLSSDYEVLTKLENDFKDKEFKTPEMLSIMNLIMQRFSIKAFEIEDELGLPIHVKLPVLQEKKA